MKFIPLTELDTGLPMKVNAEQLLEIYDNNHQSGSILVYNSGHTRLVKETVSEVMSLVQYY